MVRYVIISRGVSSILVFSRLLAVPQSERDLKARHFFCAGWIVSFSMVGAEMKRYKDE